MSVVPPPTILPNKTGTLEAKAGNAPTQNGEVPDTFPIPTIVSEWLE